MSILEANKEVKVEKSLCNILNLQLCKDKIPQNEIIIDENNNCVTNNNNNAWILGTSMSLYGNNNYGFNKIMNHDIDCVIFKIKIKQSKYNNGGGMLFGVTENNYNVSYNHNIRYDKGKKVRKQRQCLYQTKVKQHTYKLQGTKCIHPRLALFSVCVCV